MVAKSQVYWEYTISGTCAYVGLGTQSYSISSCPGLGGQSLAIGDSAYGAEFAYNASTDLGIDLKVESGLETQSMCVCIYAHVNMLHAYGCIFPRD